MYNNFLDRTYNFQVDNGLFVAEHYTKMNYKDITLEDLQKHNDDFSDRIKMYHTSSKLGSMTLHNSYLTQRNKDIKTQMLELLNNVGNDKACCVCGKKRVNVDMDFAYSSLMFGTPSPDKFINRSDNLKMIDVCPICLYLSILSFINTQKMGYAILFNTDSDEMMRDITADVQNRINKNIMLEIEGRATERKFLETVTELKSDKEIYNDLGYVELIRFSNNPQSPTKIEMFITDNQIILLNKIKYAGLIDEFFSKNLFRSMTRGYNLIRGLSRYEDVSVELYDILKEDYMTKKEIELVEKITDKLIEFDGIKALSDLRLVVNKSDFRKFLIDYSSKVDLISDLREATEIIERYYDYKDYLILNLQIRLRGDM